MPGPFLTKHLSNNKALQLFHLMRQGSTILVAVFLAKSVLTTEEIGVFELLLYLGYTFSFFWVSGLIQGMLTLFPSKSESEKRLFYTNTYLLFLALSILIFLVMWFGENWVLTFFTGQSSLAYYRLFLVYFLINIPTYLLEHYYLLNNKPLKIVGFGLFSFAGYFLVVLIPVFLGWGLLWSFYGLIALAIIKHVWLLLYLFGRGHLNLNTEFLKEWLVISLPLIMYAFIAGFNQSFGAWLVNFHYEGNEAIFAIFRYGARELPLAMAMANAFNVVMLPEVVKNTEEAIAMIRQKSVKLLHLLFPISVILMLSSHWWFPIVFNPEFYSSALIFNVFLLVLITRLIFPQTILIGLKANKTILLISVLEFSFNIIISFILVHYLGILGVALGTVFAYLLEKILLCFFLMKRYRIAPGQYINLKWFIPYTLLLLLSFIASLQWHQSFFQTLN